MALMRRPIMRHALKWTAAAILAGAVVLVLASRRDQDAPRQLNSPG